MRTVYKLLFSFALLFLFSTCKKEINEADYDSAGNMLSTQNIAGRIGQMLKKPDGSGYMIVYDLKDGYGRDYIAIAVTDNKFKILSNNTISSINSQPGYRHCFDDMGNLYVCGITTNRSLKMDKTLSGNDDAYLAKVAPNGKLLWERAYCDTVNGRKGIGLDQFYESYFINGKIYCAGATGSWQIPRTGFGNAYDMWVVAFDENGNNLMQRLMPGVYLNDNDRTNFSGANWQDAIKLKNNDLLFRYIYSNNASVVPLTTDTVALLARYSPQSDSILWTRYYRRNTAQEDISNFGELPNGNIACFDSYYNTYSIIDPNNGNPISVIPTGFVNSGVGTAYNNYSINWGLISYSTDEGLYVFGSFVEGANYQKPWLLKLDHNGNLAYSKIYDISTANFSSMAQNGQGNLQLIGSIFKAGTKDPISFVLSTDKNGNIIKP